LRNSNLIGRNSDIIFVAQFRVLNKVDKIAGIAQLVERNLAKVDVAGSSPVSRSTLQRNPISF
jgi:hypothetical protein